MSSEKRVRRAVRGGLEIGISERSEDEYGTERTIPGHGLRRICRRALQRVCWSKEEVCPCSRWCGVPRQSFLEHPKHV